MAVTRIQNNQIFDQTITYTKIAAGTLVGSLFNPNLTLNSNVTIQGNLAVMGASTTISSTNTYVNDPIIVFNNGFTGAPSYDVGMLINRNLNGSGPTGSNTAWVWTEANGGQFEAIYTTETGGTVGVINNNGYVTVKTGNLIAVTGATLGDVVVSGDQIATGSTNASLTLAPNGTGKVVSTADINPSSSGSLSLGTGSLAWNNVYANAFDFGGAVITTSGGNVTITPPNGGSTVVANLAITGSGSTYSGSVSTSNAAISGGSINNTPIGGTTAAAGTFTSITDTGSLTANGANATISLAPTGTGTVTINPATAGTMNNVVIGGSTPLAGTFTTVNTTGLATLNSLSTGAATITGGAITNTTISGSTGSFTTLAASGLTHITDTTQSTVSTDGALVVAGGVGVGKDVSVGGNIRVAATTTLGTVTVDALGTISTTSGALTLAPTGNVIINSLSYPTVDGAVGTVIMTDGAGHLSMKPIIQVGAGNAMPLGSPTTGTLTDNSPAISTWTSATYVTDAVDKLNEVLGKLIPAGPGTFPNATPLSVTGLSSGLYMSAFTQTNNTTTGSKQLAGGSTVTAYRRAASYSVNTFSNMGPGESGNVSIMKNGVSSGTQAVTTGNGTTGDLTISNYVDYGTISGKALGFWKCFTATASGTVSAGWNEVYMTDTAGTATNTAAWYYDASAPGTPIVTASTFAPTTTFTSMSSSVPHYTSSTVWTATGTANRLSGDMYPASTLLISPTAAGGSFSAPNTVTYAAAGVTTPLVQNLYVASSNATWSTTTTTLNATGVSSSGPSFSVSNSYNTGSGSATPGGNVLTIKANDTTKVDENYISATGFGLGGSDIAVRVGGLAAGADPTLGSVAAWSSSAALATTDAAVVAGVLSCNTTNYSTGYFPVGPNLSTQAATQYATFRIAKPSTSKFDISVTGKFAACHVAMAGGTAYDLATLPTNGWLDMTVAYGGSGIPGTGTGGNGSVGCALGGAITVGSSVTQSRTVTFGTESSTNSLNNYIYVRFTLNTGDSISALSFIAAH
jgi:hypothetical protein